MPELPDVESFRRYLNATALHKKITEVAVEADILASGVSISKLERRLKGAEFQSTRRHGKYLFVQVDDHSWLVLHFGMTGFLRYFKDKSDAPDHCRLLLSFSNGYHLAYDLQRKLGSIDWTTDLPGFLEQKELGPDALDLSFDDFQRALQGRKGQIKSTLMNQQIIAGMGNVYADEALFQTRIDPRITVDELSQSTLRRLHRTLQTVLEKTIEAKADPEQFPKSYLTRHREKGGQCPRCQGKLKKIQVSGRSTYHCPRCQQG